MGNQKAIKKHAKAARKALTKADHALKKLEAVYADAGKAEEVVTGFRPIGRQDHGETPNADSSVARP